MSQLSISDLLSCEISSSYLAFLLFPAGRLSGSLQRNHDICCCIWFENLLDQIYNLKCAQKWTKKTYFLATITTDMENMQRIDMISAITVSVSKAETSCTSINVASRPLILNKQVTFSISFEIMEIFAIDQALVFWPLVFWPLVFWPLYEAFVDSCNCKCSNYYTIVWVFQFRDQNKSAYLIFHIYMGTTSVIKEPPGYRDGTKKSNIIKENDWAYLWTAKSKLAQ